MPEKCAWTLGDVLGTSLTVGDVQVPKGATHICYYGCRWSIGVAPDFWWRNSETEPYVGYARASKIIGTGEQCDGTEGANAGGGSASDTPPVDPAPFPDPPCAPGYIPGTVTYSGVTTTLCQPAIDTQADKKEVKKEPTPDGEKQTTTNETTVCNVAGSCTTTTTTSTSINGGPATQTTTEKTEGKQAYCASGSGKKECGTGSGSWQGNCDSGFKGEGDPVLVAMAKEVHVQNCMLNKPTEESDLYDAERVKDGNRTGDLPGNDTVTISSSSFDQSSALGGGACVQDLQVVVMGQSLSLPFSVICDQLSYLGAVLMGISFLLAARIVSRG